MKKVAIIAILLFCLGFSALAQVSTGNLKNINFTGQSSKSTYQINGTQLQRITEPSIQLTTPDQSCVVTVSFSKTVMLAKGQPTNEADKNLIEDWAQRNKMVSKAVKQKDANGSLVMITYQPVSDTKNVEIQEQLTMLVSTDPEDKNNLGKTGFGPFFKFSDQVADVQYRRLNTSTTSPINKIILQILWVKDHGHEQPLGAYVIVAKTSGEYEFHLVPKNVLDQILIQPSLVATR